LRAEGGHELTGVRFVQIDEYVIDVGRIAIVQRRRDVVLVRGGLSADLEIVGFMIEQPIALAGTPQI
jgi:hypothetical protein